VSYDRHDRAMDRYITGNWGEDQFRGMCECDFPENDPVTGEQFTCTRCGTIWQFDGIESEWGSIGQVESVPVEDWPEPPLEESEG
jgi:hypothetical protein